MRTYFRAYCVDPLCKWESPSRWSDEENAYTDLNDHIQMEHTSQTGVRGWNVSKPKDPNRICGYDWGGTPEPGPMDSGWSCSHVCSLTVAEHGEYHYCCNTPTGRTEL